jgi:hypothetical protein
MRGGEQLQIPIRSISSRGNVVASPIVKLGGSRGLMIGGLLSHFELASVLQIRGDPGRVKLWLPIRVAIPAAFASRIGHVSQHQ